MKRVGNSLLFEDLELVEDKLAGREWFFDQFTACDAYFFWCFKRAISFKLDLSRFRNCAAHHARMLERASVKKILAYENKVLEEFARAA